VWLTFAILAIGGGKLLPGGWKYFVMESNSMAPIIPEGSLVVVKQKTEYEVGEVISFYAKVRGEEKIVAHRIVEIGGNTYVTQGDQNAAWDAVPVEPRLVIGKVEKVVFGWGRVITMMREWWGKWLLVALPVALVIINEALKIKNELTNDATDGNKTDRRMGKMV